MRGDSAYGTSAVIGAARRAGAQFSLVLTRNTAVQKAIEAIPEQGWTPVRYPGAVQDPDTGDWISDAEVAEISYTALASTKDAITARLIVRGVKDARHRDALFPVWRYRPFFTNSDEPPADADITHRRHAIIETTFADLIDGPLAHMPSGHSAPTRPGCCALPSPTTCCAPRQPWPVAATPHARRFRAPRSEVSLPLRGRRAVFELAATSGGVAPQLPRDRPSRSPITRILTPSARITAICSRSEKHR